MNITPQPKVGIQFLASTTVAESGGSASDGTDSVPTWARITQGHAVVADTMLLECTSAHPTDLTPKAVPQGVIPTAFVPTRARTARSHN